ncbi:hypothetical protein SAMD00019534_051270 [Acytostelium subglobosum LB1]|uniref:hypothetical protein n=1 Tax=Acytostelium subglobosum LB1 TaxID=1410327 RepID=UPI000644CED4|nr:hypothetical protein SAMD00019534_051270 [Acytostelium subglobosum LB1]GAM21952.1 hypothetical protein SAMD00019534_051270 [Acytostelium subglobosum LB1]|eukprot:XP_012755052.1 hypothetical protein SAMD00019534_051270 [Acytostelium subglobosum LB1]
MDIIDQEIVSKFKQIGIVNRDDLSKFDRITKEFGLTPDAIFNEWQQYAVKKMINEDFGKHIDPFRILIKKQAVAMKRALQENEKQAQLQQQAKSQKTTATSRPKTTTTTTSTTTAAARPKASVSNADLDFDFDMDDSTNNNNNNNKNNGDDFDFDFDLPDAAKSLLHLNGAKHFNYESRQNIGQSTQLYCAGGFKAPASDSGSNDTTNTSITVLGKGTTSKDVYMSDTLHGRTKQLAESVTQYHDKFSKVLGVETNTDSEELIRAVGRVWIDRSSLALHKRFHLLGNTLRGVDSFSINTPVNIFTGQVIMVEGKNIPGSNFLCSNIYYPNQLPFHVPEQDSSARILFASGPFSLFRANDYSPFNDLLQVIQNKKYNIVILFGPFVQQANLDINKLDKTFDQVFEELINMLAEITDTTFIVVPSVSDLCHDYVYPQSPFRLESKRYKNIKFVSNPSTLLINNSITIGLDNSGIVEHLQYVLSDKKKSNKVDAESICRMIIQQQNYYPLHPAEVPLEMSRLPTLSFPGITPDILLFANADNFAKSVDNVLCVSAGQMVGNERAGTYVELMINANSGGNDKTAIPIAQRSRVTAINI